MLTSRPKRNRYIKRASPTSISQAASRNSLNQHLEPSTALLLQQPPKYHNRLWRIHLPNSPPNPLRPANHFRSRTKSASRSLTKPLTPANPRLTLSGNRLPLPTNLSAKFEQDRRCLIVYHLSARLRILSINLSDTGLVCRLLATPTAEWSSALKSVRSTDIRWSSYRYSEES